MKEPQRVCFNGGLLPTALRDLAGAGGMSNATLLTRFQAYLSYMGYCVCKIRISGLGSCVGLHVAGFVCGLFFC